MSSLSLTQENFCSYKTGSWTIGLTIESVEEPKGMGKWNWTSLGNVLSLGIITPTIYRECAFLNRNISLIRKYLSQDYRTMLLSGFTQLMHWYYIRSTWNVHLSLLHVITPCFIDINRTPVSSMLCFIRYLSINKVLKILHRPTVDRFAYSTQRDTGHFTSEQRVPSRYHFLFLLNQL